MLTEIKIKALAPKEKLYKVFDGRGLYIEVLPSGTKVWRTRRFANGRDIRQTIGEWPLVSLKKARELNEKAKIGRITGEAERPGPEAPTLAEVAERWQAKYLPSVAEGTAKRVGIKFSKYIIPALGASRVDELTSEAVLTKLLRPIEADGHLDMAHRVKATLGRVLRFAIAEGSLGQWGDVTTTLGNALASSQRKHRPTIVDLKRVGRLMLDIRNYSGSPVVAAALRMLPYVFVRPGELRCAEWTEFDLKNLIWRIPAERMKMRTAHLVPLSNQVVEMLERLRPLTGKGRYLFPGRNLKTKPLSNVAINAALRYLGYGRDEICGHGFRAMASTILNERGYNSDWIERQLAHIERNGVRAAYNHADWLPERRKMMQDWADLLDSLADDASKD